MAGSVFFVGAKSEAAAIVFSVVQGLTGAGGPNADLASGVGAAVGFAALADIHGDFITKARGGTGADGVKWEPLKPATLAYGRRAPRGRGFAPGGKDGLLTRAQLKRWQQIFGSRFHRFVMSMDESTAASSAAAIAWATIKKDGGKTKIAEYANRPHEIGRDTGVLLNSLSPGTLNGGNYQKPADSQDQIFEQLGGGVIVGTNVAYASAFAARRPIVPQQVPQQWVDGWVRVADRALAEAVKVALQRGTA